MLYVAGTFGGLCADYSLVCDFFFLFFLFFRCFGEKRGSEREKREED